MFTAQIINTDATAPQKLVISKPGIIKLTSQKRKIFITNINKPKVRIVIGKVSNTNIGLIITLTIAKTKATNKAIQKPETSMPGMK